MYTVPIRLVPPRFPVDPPPKSHKTINYLLVLVQTTSPKKKVMLNSDDAIHIVPLLWAGLGATSYLFAYSSVILHRRPSIRIARK